ncbi:hypothetical protein CLV56_1080 [Mumia flava]|uniref:Subunit length determinant protein n=1 Tax=Mumia flava TaxID=1348852 RepID=A0A0B2B1C7_9ACTN|nr:hypothetical protein [Mumia flava]PJJ56866.1 hypothetical protein CLV56_1080 [Mumia flava]
MGEQALDVRSAVAGLRRHRGALLGAGLLGAGAGLALVVLQPPMYASTSQVLLPPAKDATGQPISREVATEIRVAGSDLVLAPVARSLTPPESVAALSKRVDIEAPTRDVLEFTAMAPSAGDAESLARALAESEVEHANDASDTLSQVQRDALKDRRKTLRTSLKQVSEQIEETKTRRETEDPASVEGKADAAALAQLTAEQANLVLQIDQVNDRLETTETGSTATIIQDATPAERPALLARAGVLVAAGLLLGLLLGATVMIVLGRRDRRLRYRDEIADAIGTAVVGSVHTIRPRDAAGWGALLSDYTPETVDSWALRQVLRHLADPDAESEAVRRTPVAHPGSLTVLSLAGDQRGLAVGPLLASYAASIGIETELVAAQGHDAAATLWAMIGQNAGQELREGLTADNRLAERSVDLTVVLVVVDPSDARLDSRPGTDATVLAVSAGSSTAEDLARVAMTADDAGGRIDGIVVADPDDLDRTTGRLLQRERAIQASLPVRLTGVPSGDARGDIADLRRGQR